MSHSRCRLLAHCLYGGAQTWKREIFRKLAALLWFHQKLPCYQAQKKRGRVSAASSEPEFVGFL
jgi:hypothetical protein